MAEEGCRKSIKQDFKTNVMEIWQNLQLTESTNNKNFDPSHTYNTSLIHNIIR